MTDQTWLQSLKVGDEVAWRMRDRDGYRYWIGQVHRITPTTLVAAATPDLTGWSEFLRFRKSDLREIGGQPGAAYLWLCEATAEVKGISAEERERYEFWLKLRDTDLEELTLDQLRRIVAILDEPRKDGE